VIATGTSVAVTQQIPARAALNVATRLGVVYLPAAIVGLAVAVLGRPQRRARRAPAIVAAVVALGAVLQLLHALLPGESRGLPAVGPLAHATGAFAGLALLFAARGLARR